MFNKSFCLILIIINNFHNGESVNYYPNTSKQVSVAAAALPQLEHHLFHDVAPAENYNNNNPAASYSSYQQNHEVSSEPNPQTNRNYQQFYRYYNEATPLRQPAQSEPTQLWLGPPIVVGADMHLTSQIPQTTYEYNNPYNALPFMRRHSKALPVHRNQQQTSNTQQLNYDNNNNFVYRRDFRHETDALPESKGVQQHRPIYNQQQQYASNTNIPYDYAIESSQNNFNLNNPQYDSNRNNYASLRMGNVIDYTDYFKRYLENNPSRIKPLY